MEIVMTDATNKGYAEAEAMLHDLLLPNQISDTAIRVARDHMMQFNRLASVSSASAEGRKEPLTATHVTYARDIHSIKIKPSRHHQFKHSLDKILNALGIDRGGSLSGAVDADEKVIWRASSSWGPEQAITVADIQNLYDMAVAFAKVKPDETGKQRFDRASKPFDPENPPPKKTMHDRMAAKVMRIFTKRSKVA